MRDVDGVAKLVGVTDAVRDAVAVFEGVCVGDAPGDSDGVGVTLSDALSVSVPDGVGDCDGVAVADGVAEHESGTERPVAAHPHAHGSGADDASGQ